MNFIVSVNDNPTYFPFLEKVIKLCKAFGHRIYVAYVTKNKKIFEMDYDGLLILEEVEGYESGIQAKLARSFYASKLYDNKPYTLLDVDQFLIDFEWLQNSIDENCSTDYDLLAFGANGYKTGLSPLNPNIDGKFPMYFTTATPEGFRKLFDIDKNTKFSELLKKNATIKNPRDGFESTKNTFNRFSDESLFAWLIREHSIKVKHVDLEKWEYRGGNPSSGRRIDRDPSTFLKWDNPAFGLDFWKQKKLNSTQKLMILNNHFFDVFPARPYHSYKELIDDIFKTIMLKAPKAEKRENL